ncbi:MAG: polysaccharide biosynthesis/export family protein [Bryobacteraceae bacterium]
MAASLSLAGQQTSSTENASNRAGAAATADVKAGPEKTPSTGEPIDPKAYIIGPEDVLAVTVWREPGNSGQFTVRPDGKISLPLVGAIQAAGITPEQLSASIGQALEKVLQHPEVTVGVEKVNSKKYYINGEINKPGAYPLVVPTTVLEALVNAGGFKDFANTKKITILRGAETFKFNYNEVSKGKKMEQNIQLRPGDQIFVR